MGRLTAKALATLTHHGTMLIKGVLQPLWAVMRLMDGLTTRMLNRVTGLADRHFSARITASQGRPRRRTFSTGSGWTPGLLQKICRRRIFIKESPVGVSMAYLACASHAMAGAKTPAPRRGLFLTAHLCRAGSTWDSRMVMR